MERPRQAWVDTALAERMRRGDPSALAEAYDAYAGLVHGLALRVLRDRKAAGEVTQQVFVALWEAPDRFDGSPSTLHALLAAMTHRCAVDAIRLGPPARPDGAADVDPERPRSGRVRHAVEHLPDAQRRALELTYLRGRTYREVADELGVPEATAKSRLRLALQGIAESLRGEMSRQWA